ncbi:GlmL-related ornithine degradation protein [Fusobacterium hwasookii]|uniref:DNA mismatch repair protein MutL n=1 Tax=Fusobacterium hwasookii ChDC F206 TaxID=1307443 RepID=A0AAC9F1G0_9FUSO|nr:GlmL-related ornithine degradation protein [Fusobacterium hwasookii]ALQ36082.1 DNA mismatch repair protein MutL [Fusobacterium hwasookii ChDC F206]ALQ37291.1 DNA mismatch repair protein MutL [Fusobacterium hwasookii ChDC F300]QNE67757.1 glutamate mutase L [Fusobacterium hwasookii]QYR55155.1 glutamate mutase L [Fusobacterium hwasookii]
MKIDVLIAEIGSTTTVVNAFDNLESENPVFLGQGQAPTSVKEGDVNIGLQAAIEDMKKSLHIENENLEYRHMLATSSAAGGLRMTVHGLVYDMTVKAAKEAALGAGANIHLITAGKLSKVDMIKLDRIKPNIILIAGGVDYGERETALYNSEIIAASDLDIPVIYAGNIAVADDVKLIFESYSKEKNLHVVPNVYPKIDILNIEPTREVIQDIFEKHITEAKGMEKIREMVNGPIIPTPGAVMKASKILKDEIGDLVTIDVGGATTDIHSVTEGTEKVKKVLVEPEPVAKRTVEGDLGVFINKKNIVDIIKIENLEKELNMTFEDVENFTNSDIAIPESEEHKRFIERLTKEAVIVSINRHAGGYRTYFGGKTNTLAFGKDLTGVKWLIGTGGALTRLTAREEILNSISQFNRVDKLLPTAEAQVLIDNDYIMASLGVLSSLYKEAAVKLLLKSLKFNENVI